MNGQVEEYEMTAARTIRTNGIHSFRGTEKHACYMPVATTGWYVYLDSLGHFPSEPEKNQRLITVHYVELH